MKQYDEWNTLKKSLNDEENKVFFRERDVFWTSIGINVGYEQDGKGEIFSRPVLVLRKYSKNIFLGIPLSTKLKEGSFFFEFSLNNERSNALLVQARVYDAKRLENKIGMIGVEEFEQLKLKVRELMNV